VLKEGRPEESYRRYETGTKNYKAIAEGEGDGTLRDLVLVVFTCTMLRGDSAHDLKGSSEVHLVRSHVLSLPRAFTSTKTKALEILSFR
jgi:hypothetical protein